jgi:hypothetical protein
LCLRTALVRAKTYRDEFSGCNEYESILKRFFVTGDDSSTNNYRHERSYITKFALRQITSFFGVDKFLVGLMKKM